VHELPHNKRRDGSSKSAKEACGIWAAADEGTDRDEQLEEGEGGGGEEERVRFKHTRNTRGGG